MVFRSTSLTDSLRRALSHCHDPGQPSLVVVACGGGVEVTRVGGAELSTSEQHEVRARVACHGAGVDHTPTVKLRVSRGCNELVEASEE